MAHLVSLGSLLILASFLLFAFFNKPHHAHKQYASDKSSFMPLPWGFNRTLSNLSYYISPNVAIPPHDAVGMANVDGGAFFPILSSPSFNTFSQTPGFSLGFYQHCNGTFECAGLYMAVCAGFSGDMANARGTDIFLEFDASGSIYPLLTSDGFAAPVWIANFHQPIKYALDASLVVVAVADIPELQLRDGHHVLWRVSNAGMMEMQDSGEFLIHPSSTNSAQSPVFQRSGIFTDTLVQGQNLAVGMELRSNNSAYSAKLEKGGLVLYLENNIHFGMMQPPPYWVFPIFRNPDPHSPNPTINQLVSSAPSCTNRTQPLHLALNLPETSLFVASLSFEPLDCSSAFKNGTSITPEWSVDAGGLNLSWRFLRLENDGRLYFYSVVKNSSSALRNVAASQAIFSGSGFGIEGNFGMGNGILHIAGTECNVPMACGPMGMCNPGAKSMQYCSCPDFFKPIDEMDLTRGCKRQDRLPSCTRPSNDHFTSISFVELNSTSTIFLFNGWIFNSSSVGGSLMDCKQACSLDCSCHGVFYQVSTSSCYLMTDEIGLFKITNTNVSVFNYTATSKNYVSPSEEIHANDYIACLKIATMSNYSSSTRSFSKMALLGIVPFGIVMFLLLGLGAYYWRKRQIQLAQLAKEEEELCDILPLLPTRFSYKELHEATKGFCQLLGTGGCGSVYAGTLLDGRRVAVKVLEGLLQGAHQSKQFLAEIATIGRTNHHNIVRLVGFSWQVSHRLLVYEYVERGSLDHWLFGLGGGGDMLLDWKKRYDIMLGVIRGLHYLHEECEQPILHFDIKPQNILLNDAFVAKLADFGMSRLMNKDMTSVMTGLRGTPGYIAPEWSSHGTVSKKSDIYSMGVVMLEIVAGRRVLDLSLLRGSKICDNVEDENDEWHLPSWAIKKWVKGCASDIFDKRLVCMCGLEELQQMQRFLHISLWCIHEDPILRPHATTLVQWVESSLPIPKPPISTIVELRH